ncbi:MAG: DNA-deoxyinosine glycosylase [Roseburia sp.]
MEHVIHTFAPVYDETSRVLILGSFPSVKSRENQFYYGHPQNRFWKVTAGIFGKAEPATIEEKKAFLLENHIALWDVIASCDIEGSADSSIRGVTANDMDVILAKAPIRGIFCNGDKAYQMFLKYCRREGQPAVYKLPSTSPANAAWSLERLTEEWKKYIIEETEKEGGKSE